jgi:G3E family GTPase
MPQRRPPAGVRCCDSYERRPETLHWPKPWHGLCEQDFQQPTVVGDESGASASRHGDMTTSRIPVTVLTGFLGAGKTTLLNRILCEPHGRRYAIIVNEYGEVGIDGALVVSVEDEVYELNNGCVCCKVRGDLIRVVSGLIRRGRAFDGILIETSGLADPAPVLQTFVLDDLLRQHTRLDSVVCVTDARHLPAQIDNDVEAMQQVAQADLVLVNKVDLATPAEIAQAEAAVVQLNPTAQVLHTASGNAPLQALLDRGTFDLSRLQLPVARLGAAHPGRAHRYAAVGSGRHSRDVEAVALVFDQPFDQAHFSAWLQQLIVEQGGRILRAKGIVAFEGVEQRFVFQAVHMTVDTYSGALWRSDEPRASRVVFIGRGLDAQVLTDGLRRCHAAAVTVTL